MPTSMKERNSQGHSLKGDPIILWLLHLGTPPISPGKDPRKNHPQALVGKGNVIIVKYAQKFLNNKGLHPVEEINPEPYLNWGKEIPLTQSLPAFLYHLREKTVHKSELQGL